jgi:hypothetical protein
MSMHTELRAREGDRMPYRMGVTGAYRDEAAQGAALADAPGLTDAQILDDAIADALARYGLPAEVARPAVLARGAGSGEERVVLFGFTFPSGATAAWLLQHESMPDGGHQSTLGRLPHAPAGTALADRLIGVPVDGYRIAVHAPAAASGVEVLTADGRVLGLVPLTDGGHVGEVPGGAFVPSTDGAASLRAVDASGATVAEAPIGRVEAR